MAESRHRYLFERLGDHDFQQLVNALLVRQYPDYTPMALRQADGGRDGLEGLDPRQVIVYQTKWTVRGSERDAVAWLEKTVRDEEKNLRRLAKEGVRKYRLVTNVASTAKPKVGTHDRLAEKLRSLAEDFGFDEMTCVWRELLNPWVDNAPTELKWGYADMLAGWDLVRYIVAENVDSNRDKGHRDVIRKVVATQWDDDKRVKFSQADVDRELVAELFVDVTADRVHSPAAAVARALAPKAIGGAATYLLGGHAPFTLVRGAPGQGKSTLSQYVSQAFRAAFMPSEEQSDALPRVPNPRFPIRVDLSDYALWLDGADVWTSSDVSGKPRKPRDGQGTLDVFLAELMTHDGGGKKIGANTVQDIFDRVPTVVVLDGLDEVGSSRMRKRVVEQIDRFVSRSRSYSETIRVIVTTRPSAGELAEPSPERFEVITLNQLTSDQRDTYLRKWCLVRGIHGKDGRALRKSFKEKSAEPYIEELAGNPMQLTILLDLLHEQGAATPTQRTELYDKYVDLLLAREANKKPKVVRAHRDELMEIIPFLGWYLHAHSEDSAIDGRMSTSALKAAMHHFQKTYGKSESAVDALFEGATDRLWALTSKTDGVFEFEVLSLREYFAARFLFNNAGEEDRTFDSAQVLRELLRRPYWLNTARFYGGNAKGSSIYMLTAGIEDELREATSPTTFLAAWALLIDGVFHQRPREARRTLSALCSDAGIPVLLAALDRRDIVPLRAVPQPLNEGDDPTWLRLTGLIQQDPAARSNRVRVRALRELLSMKARFDDWWYDQFIAAIGGPSERAWLQIGADCEAGAGRTCSSVTVDLSDGGGQLFLSTGLVAPPGQPLEAALFKAVLNSECVSVASTRSAPAQVAVALSPSAFFTTSKQGFTGQSDLEQRRRNAAISQLRRAQSPFASIASQRIFSPGHKGSTAPWVAAASALHEYVGLSWLGTEIAVIGASSPFSLSYTPKVGATAFGPRSHPSELVGQTRRNSANREWWEQRLDEAEDDFSRAQWALALWGVASGEVLRALLSSLDVVLGGLGKERRLPLLRAAARMTRHGFVRGRGVFGDVVSEQLASLLHLRAEPFEISPVSSESSEFSTLTPTMPSLLTTARGQRWLKVDTTETYR